MLRACDVGHRVVVRRVVGPGPLLSDVLGELVALDEAWVIVRTDDGVELTIERSDVTAAKRVPPRPVRHSEIVALELVGNRCWPAPEVERLGDWYLRAADGWTNRANSALPLGDPGLPLDGAFDACRDWYARRNLPPKITVPLPVRRDIARALTDAGWVRQPLVLVQTATIADLAGENQAGENQAGENQAGEDPAGENLAGEDGRVTLHLEPSEDFLAIVAARKESLPPSSRSVLLGVQKVRFAEVRQDGALLAIARGAVVDGWLHLSVVEVLPAARRRGYAVDVSRALGRWARDEGATRALLQVEERNTPAVALYGRLGFTTHHTYETFRLDLRQRQPM